MPIIDMSLWMCAKCSTVLSLLKGLKMTNIPCLAQLSHCLLQTKEVDAKQAVARRGPKETNTRRLVPGGVEGERKRKTCPEP